MSLSLLDFSCAAQRQLLHPASKTAAHTYQQETSPAWLALTLYSCPVAVPQTLFAAHMPAPLADPPNKLRGFHLATEESISSLRRGPSLLVQK
jgi:hypothetical protein